MADPRRPYVVQSAPDLRPWSSRAWDKVVGRAKEIVIVTTALGVFGLSIGGIGAAVLRYCGVARVTDISRLDTSIGEIKTAISNLDDSVKKAIVPAVVTGKTEAAVRPPSVRVARRKQQQPRTDAE